MLEVYLAQCAENLWSIPCGRKLPGTQSAPWETWLRSTPYLQHQCPGSSRWTWRWNPGPRKVSKALQRSITRKGWPIAKWCWIPESAELLAAVKKQLSSQTKKLDGEQLSQLTATSPRPRLMSMRASGLSAGPHTLKKQCLSDLLEPSGVFLNWFGSMAGWTVPSTSRCSTLRSSQSQTSTTDREGGCYNKMEPLAIHPKPPRSIWERHWNRRDSGQRRNGPQIHWTWIPSIIMSGRIGKGGLQEWPPASSITKGYCWDKLG